MAQRERPDRARKSTPASNSKRPHRCQAPLQSIVGWCRPTSVIRVVLQPDVTVAVSCFDRYRVRPRAKGASDAETLEDARCNGRPVLVRMLAAGI